MVINEELLTDLLNKAKNTDRLRINYDLRTSSEDSSQRMLNAFQPGTVIPIHRHPLSTENIFVLKGSIVEIFYDNCGNETERIRLNQQEGLYGCVVPAGIWHTVEVLEPTVIYDVKDGKYGQDGSEAK